MYSLIYTMTLKTATKKITITHIYKVYILNYIDLKILNNNG